MCVCKIPRSTELNFIWRATPPSHVDLIKSGKYPLVKSSHSQNHFEFSLRVGNCPTGCRTGANVVSILAEEVSIWIGNRLFDLCAGGVLTGTFPVNSMLNIRNTHRLNTIGIVSACELDICALFRFCALFSVMLYPSSETSLMVISVFSLAWLTVMFLFPFSLYFSSNSIEEGYQGLDKRASSFFWLLL